MAKKRYLLIFDEENIKKANLYAILKKLDEVEEYYTYFSFSVFVEMEKDARWLLRQIAEKYPKADVYITRIDLKDNDGLLTQVMWDFINKPLNN